MHHRYPHGTRCLWWVLSSYNYSIQFFSPSACIDTAAAQRSINGMLGNPAGAVDGFFQNALGRSNGGFSGLINALAQGDVETATEIMIKMMMRVVPETLQNTPMFQSLMQAVIPPMRQMATWITQTMRVPVNMLASATGNMNPMSAAAAATDGMMNQISRNLPFMPLGIGK